MKNLIGKGGPWWKSALAGIVIPVLLCALFPFAVLAVFAMGIFGFINVGKKKVSDSSVLETSGEAGAKSTQTLTGTLDGETLLKSLDKFKEIVRESKK